MKTIFVLILSVFITACATEAGTRLGDGPAYDYELIFEGFSSGEVFEFEDTLTRFSEYHSHELVYSSERRSEYRYAMALGPDRLNNSLRAILGDLELKSLVRFSDGNRFELKKVVRRNRDSADDGYNF